METIVILVFYIGKWVTSKKMCKYEGAGKTRSAQSSQFLMASNEWKHIKIEDDDDVKFFMKYNCEVTPLKLAPLLVSIEDKGLKNDVVDSMHMTRDNSRIGRSSVAIVESNEVTQNNTNVVVGDVGTDIMDMIDFSEVEEMHGSDNGTETNEVSVYYAPPILGRLDTSA
ncbi:hypothetical protein L3X38_003954 [Prunus dulcis]|uniref:Uncharacterized protein n=1 Tax=Prunus dulcis TaxID=3755 RepID=A0AAD5F2S3_PRUDU|nr:hypothetical protein L3X38_003954 [Prunus dulcis]